MSYRVLLKEREVLSYYKVKRVDIEVIKWINKKSGIYYYDKIKNFDILKRSEIKEIPKDSDELYVKLL